MPDGDHPPAHQPDPGRPGGDGRLHPPERQQAARPVHRRRLIRQDRDGIVVTDIERPGRRRPPLGPRRSAPSRSALEDRRGRGQGRPDPAHRPRPGTPSGARHARCRERPGRWSRSCRCPRPRASTATPDRHPGPLADGRRRRDGRPRRRWPPGALGPRLDQGQPRRVAEQRAELAAACRAPRRPGASRAASSRAPMASAQVASPSAQMCRPTRASTRAAMVATCSSAAARRAVGARAVEGRHPDVDRVGPGVGRDLGVRGAQDGLAQDLGQLRLADPGRPEGARGERRAEPLLAQAGERLVGPHRAHLAGRAGHGHDDPAIRAAARTSRAPCRWGWPAPRRRGCARPACRFISGKGSPRRFHSARSQRSSPGSTTGVSPHTAAMASRVRSSGVGPRPPVEITRSARSRALANASRTTSRTSGTATRRSMATPAAVRPRASSPAFVSRVSPTVSSAPMDTIEAMRSGRGGTAWRSVVTAAA